MSNRGAAKAGALAGANSAVKLRAETIEVREDALRIEVSLSWLLAKAAKRLLPILRKEAMLLLEKK